jgi:hypothetical protein
MRKAILLGAILLPATMLLAQGSAQPLDVKTGVWEVSMTTTINGAENPQTRTYKSCLKKEDLNKYPFVDPEKRCSYTVVSSTGTTMEAHGTCQPGSEGAKADFTMRLDALDTENVKGKGQLALAVAGRTINGVYAATAKWIADTCPAGMR